MLNDFEKYDYYNIGSTLSTELNSDFFIRSMWLEFLTTKSNNAKIKNGYVNSIKALKSFVEAI